MAYFSGQSGSVSWNSNTIQVTNWSATAETEILDTTNTGSSGWQNNISGIEKCTATTTFPMLAAGSGINTVGTSATLTLTLGNSTLNLTGTFRQKSAKFDNPAKGVVTCTAEWESNSSVTLA